MLNVDRGPVYVNAGLAFSCSECCKAVLICGGRD